MPGIMSEGSGICAHNTPSPETTHVHVLYPFHPLHGSTLQIVRKPKPATALSQSSNQRGEG